jgi:hypothetical protein
MALAKLELVSREVVNQRLSWKYRGLCVYCKDHKTFTSKTVDDIENNHGASFYFWKIALGIKWASNPSTWAEVSTAQHHTVVACESCKQIVKVCTMCDTAYPFDLLNFITSCPACKSRG